MIKFLFFAICYVVVGSAGIWIPYVVNGSYDPKTTALGLVSIVMSTIGYRATEKLLQLLGPTNDNNRKEGAYNAFALILSFIAAFIVSNRINDPKIIRVAIGAYLCAAAFWWYQNWNNSNFETKASDALGGEINN